MMTDRTVRKTLYSVLIVVLCTAGLTQAQLQLPNLEDAPTADRFVLPTDYVWPANVGEGDICLWNDDKWGAVNITIDDNTQPDHAWWQSELDARGWKATWYVITGNVGSGNSYHGTWAEFGTLQADGHDIHSHTVNHNSDDDVRPDAEVIIEYADSQAAIETNLPGYDCSTLGYPYGNGKRAIAADYYLAARGTTGGVNAANRIDYMDTKSTSDSGLNPGGLIDAVLTGSSPNISWLDERSMRGWISTHYHLVQDRVALASDLAYLESYEDKFWVGKFAEIAKYGQERDTATLTVTSATTNQIDFTISDDMDDTVFDYPLTIKFRVDNSWNDAQATQNGQSITAWVVEHQNNKYALVKAVPDQGAVVLQSLVTGDPVADAGPDQTIVDTDDSGDQSVTLDGSGSTDDGTITSYVWEENSTQIATGVNPAVIFAVGAHTVTLTVTDDTSATDTDTVVITVDPAPVGSGSTFVIDCHTDDQEVRSDGTFRWIGQADARVGGGVAAADDVYVMVFQLPTLQAGETVSDANLDVYMQAIGGVVGNVDLYGLPYRSSGTILTTDYFLGTYDTDANATAIEDDICIPSTSVGAIQTSAAANANIVAYINAQYTAGAQGGDYVFLRLTPDTDEGDYKYYTYSTANHATVSQRPVLTLDTTIPVPNVAPTADAGSDQTVTDTDDSGSEQVTLDASGSTDSDGTIASYSWEENASQIATGSNPVVSFAVGTHNVTLTVTDDEGATDTDTVVITVNAYVNVAPTADAGADQTVTDTDDSGSESVTLDGSGSADSDGTIASYVWEENSTQIATGISPAVSLAVGTHTITLTVTDDDAATDTDTVVVTVDPASTGGGTYVIDCHTDDLEIRDDGTARWIGQADARVGGGVAAADDAYVMVFALPTLGAGETITDANLDIYLASISNTPSGNADVYGLPYRSASTVLLTDYFEGVYGTDANASAIADDISVPTTPAGALQTDTTGDANLVNYLNAQYTAGAQGGDYVFIRINPDIADETDYRYYVYSTANAATASERPVLTIITSSGPANVAPTADAGSDQTVTDADDSGDESVTLDASASTDSDGTIASYVWEENSTQIATGVNPAVTLAVGTHTINLTVTDDDGDSDTDTVVVTVDEWSVTSSTTWQNFAMTSQAGQFEFAFDAVPNNAGMDGVTGISNGTAGTWSDVACIVRFSAAGVIDVRNGSSYSADTTINYVAGTKYTIRTVVNVPANTYSVFVTPDGQSETTLATDYTFRTDQQGVTSLDNWTLNATNAGDSHTVSNIVLTPIINIAPVADAGSDQTVYDADDSGSESVTLDASASTDSDGTIASYVWEENASQIASGVSPAVSFAVGTHTVTLTVTDDDGATDTDTVVITVDPYINVAPTANAGSDQTVTDSDDSGDEQISLDGSGSTDSDGTVASYVWKEGQTQVATGSNPVVTLTVGPHTLTLEVTDDDGATDSDTVDITVNAYVNVAPTADAGSDQTVTDTDDSGSESVTLDGSGSADSDGTIASYSWEENSSQIATGASPAVSFTVGTHTVTLTVTDDDGATDTDTVVITVDPAPATGGTYAITGDVADQVVRADGSFKWVGQADMRVGGGYAGTDGAAVWVFQLPTLAVDETISTANIDGYFEAYTSGMPGNVDLYAIGYRTSNTVLTTDFYQGAYDADANATALQDDIIISTSPIGPFSSDASADSALATFLAAQYAAGAQGGDYVFIRLSPDTLDAPDYKYYTFSSANRAGQEPVLTIETTTIVPNTGPSVDAGIDTSVPFGNAVSLDGTVNDDGLPNPPATVTTTWSTVSGPGTVTFTDASAVDTTATFSVEGIYVLQLEADDSELTATDTVTITVNPVVAGSHNWSGQGDGSTWSDPNNWVEGTIPLTTADGDTADSVVINGNYTVHITSDVIAIKNLTIDGNALLVVDSGITLTLQQIDVINGGIELQDVSGTGATINWGRTNRGHLYVESNGYIAGTGLIFTKTSTGGGVRLKSTRSADFDMTNITLQLGYGEIFWVCSADQGRASASAWDASNFAIGKVLLSDNRYDSPIFQADGSLGGGTNALYALEVEFAGSWDFADGAQFDLQGTNLYVRDQITWFDDTISTTSSVLTVATAYSNLDVTTSIWDDDTPQGQAFLGVDSGGGNTPPVADAGSDQTVTDTDDNGSEQIILDGTASTDSDGSIASYVWEENSSQIASGSMPVVTFAVGSHTVTLTVTDDDGATDSDTVVITVNSPANQAPTADAGNDQTVTDSDDGGDEQVTLDGSGSVDNDGSITSYVWSENSSQIATGVSPTVTLAVGSHTITLDVTDDDGASDSDTVVITVNAPSGGGDPIALLPLTNRQSGIDLNLSGTNGTDWVVEHTFHDMAYGDQLIFMKSSVDMSLAHNARNSIMKRTTTVLDAIQGVSGGGDIHYKIDRDTQAHHYSTKGTATIPSWAPLYSTPFNFNTLTYDGSLAVLGTTGNNGGAWGTRPRLNFDRFYYGQNDAAGNEWHTLTYWDNDQPLYDSVSEDSHRQGASDGHWVYICVNPITPIIQFNASGSEQFYTTPIKTYHTPKTWDQTTYLTSGVQIALINITDAQTIYYRVDGGTWQAFGGTHNLVASDLFTGTHTFEVKNGTTGAVLTRTIVMNPGYPGAGETHGNLLWADASQKALVATKLASMQPFTASYNTLKGSYEQGTATTHDDTREGWRAGADMAKWSLSNAFKTTFEGVVAEPATAALTKERLMRIGRLEPVGNEQDINLATPSKDYLSELSQTIQLYADAGIAYDLLAACFRQSDDPAGMTPIEEIRIREGLAEVAKTVLQHRSNYEFIPGGGNTHWAHGYEFTIGCIAAAMPTYSTPYFGVSGADLVSVNNYIDGNNQYWNPLPDQGLTWLEAITDTEVATPGYPNLRGPLRAEFQITDDGFWTGPNDYEADGDRYGYGPLGRILVDVNNGGFANAEARTEMVEMSGYEAAFPTRIYAWDHVRRLIGGFPRQTCVTNYINRRLIDGYRLLTWDDTLKRYTTEAQRVVSGMLAFNDQYETAGTSQAQALVGAFLSDVNKYYGYETGTYPSYIANDRKALFSPYALALCWDPSQITVTYTSPNKTPVIKPTTKYVVKPGETVHKELITMDPDGDSLTVTVSNLPSGASYNSSTKTITWTPGTGDAGVYIVTITADDGVASTSRPFPIIVKADAGSGPVPAVPTGLTATLLGGNQVQLDWTAPGGVSVANYVIYRDGTLHDVVAGNVTTYTDTDTLPNGSHTRYHIAAIDTNGGESREVSSVPDIISVPR